MNASGLRDLMAQAPGPIRILDLGSAWVREEPPPYTALVEAGMGVVVSVDADSDVEGAIHRVVADGQERSFHRTAIATASSVFAPNRPTCDRFDGLREATVVVETRTVTTVRLDDLAVRNIDYVKSDLQGADLLAFQGGTETMRHAHTVHVEVDFVQQYVGAPLFSDVDAALRAMGLDFLAFTDYGTRPIGAFPAELLRRRATRHWLWGNAVYYRSPRQWRQIGSAQLRKLALVTDACYQARDLAYEILDFIDRREGTSEASAYLAALRDEG